MIFCARIPTPHCCSAAYLTTHYKNIEKVTLLFFSAAFLKINYFVCPPMNIRKENFFTEIHTFKIHNKGKQSTYEEWRPLSFNSDFIHCTLILGILYGLMVKHSNPIVN